MARVEADAEERVAEVAVGDPLQLATDLADVERAIPLRDRSKYGATSRST